MVEEKTIKIVTEDAQVGGIYNRRHKNHMVMGMMTLYIHTQFHFMEKVNTKLS